MGWVADVPVTPRRRALLHYPILNIGGAEMSVLRMISALLDRGWQIDLVLTTGGGNLESLIDPRVNVTRLRDRPAGQDFTSASGMMEHLRFLPDLTVYFWSRLQQAVRSLPFLFRHYDFAAVCLHGLSPAFCVRFVRARKRLHWIRNDLGLCDRSGKVHRNIRKYSRYLDHYVCVSNRVRESLVEKYPELEPKAVVIRNIIDAPGMRCRADEAGPPLNVTSDRRRRVLTVCRLQDRAKGLMRMARVQRRLLDKGVDFDWYIIGDGPDRGRLEAYRDELGLQHRFILLGPRTNPFPYYRWADIVAVLSYYEGLCGTVNEAKVMGKPVIATRFSGIEEQIEDGVNGLIVENDEDSIVAGLNRLLCDDQYRESLENDYLPNEIGNDNYKLAQLEKLIS